MRLTLWGTLGAAQETFAPLFPACFNTWSEGRCCGSRPLLGQFRWLGQPWWLGQQIHALQDGPIRRRGKDLRTRRFMLCLPGVRRSKCGGSTDFEAGHPLAQSGPQITRVQWESPVTNQLNENGYGKVSWVLGLRPGGFSETVYLKTPPQQSRWCSCISLLTASSPPTLLPIGRGAGPEKHRPAWQAYEGTALLATCHASYH